MPEWFKNYLKGRSPQDKDELWAYFDGTDAFEIVNAVIELVGKPNGMPHVMPPTAEDFAQPCD